jgi:ABC-type sulfate/molybdate transport systems ATPase subunit
MAALSKTTAAVRAFEALSEEIELRLCEGNRFIFTLLGPSRAGKSELLNRSSTHRVVIMRA